MTGKSLPPELEAEVARLKGRVSDLERKLSKRIPEIRGPIVPFSLSGELFVSSSGRWVHPTGGNLVLLLATLVTPGDTATTIEARKNGDPVGDLLTIEAGGDFARTKVPDVGFAALFDRLEIAVVDAGTDAGDLVVLACFDR